VLHPNISVRFERIYILKVLLPDPPFETNIGSLFGDMCVLFRISQVFWGDKKLGYVGDIAGFGVAKKPVF